jgi:hypothetical protein
VIYAAAILSILLGLSIGLNPKRAIELQRRFYLLINWRIEPVSMPKEIRNTRAMGLFLVFLGICALVYLILYIS